MKIYWLLTRNNARYYTNIFCKYYPIQFWISQKRSLKNQATQTNKLVYKAARKNTISSFSTQA